MNPSDLQAAPAPDARQAYEARRQANATLALRLDRLALLLANLRLVLFLAAVALGLLRWWGKLPPGTGWAAAACALLFLGAAVAHDRVLGRHTRARIRVELNQRGLARLDDAWQGFAEDGARFEDGAHPYTPDLNVFGPSSLFQLLDTTTTRQGEDALAGWLRAPSPVAEALARQAALRELAPELDFRQELETEGRVLAAQKPDLAPLLRWVRLPAALRWRGWPVVAAVMPLLTFGAWLAGRFKLIEVRLWPYALLAQIAVVLATRSAAGRIFAELRGPGERILRFERIFSALEARRWSSPALAAWSERIRVRGAPASLEMRRLARAVSFLQFREQPLFHIPLNVLVLWDVHWVGALERWRARCRDRLEGWLLALGEMEALCSLAGLAYDNPGYSWPEIVDGEPRFVARELGHPLIAASRRVTNDVELAGPGASLLVTGSNMAGKTTLLRTMGVNAVLALCGAPVCARSLSISRLSVCTSMRVQDSLARGVSFFYAEVERLKKVLDVCAAGNALYLLDEVLQGTNTAERQLASRSIVKRLVRLGAIGAIATHDLGLTTLEPESGGKVRNVHFTDQIQDGEMRFDYRLRPGVVATTNALALLRKAGIDLEA